MALAGACVAVVNLAACGAESRRDAEAPAGQWVTATPTASATTRPDGLMKVTSACKLLPATVVVKVLGGSAGTKLTAKEEPFQEKGDGERRYHCVYGRDGQEALALLVSTRQQAADTASAAVDGIAKASQVKTIRVDGLGEGGVGYVVDGIRMLAVAVPYGAELRLVVFSGPAIVPHSKFVKLAEHVVAQI